MLKKILRLALVVIILLMQATPVLASGFDQINVVARPRTTGGIIGFTIIYVSDTQLDFSWTFGSGAVNIMIRGKYGSYPADIPDSFTAPSDGYLVYYGSATSCSDTSMNFNENAGTLYYKAWGQRADGTWFTTTSTGAKESKQLIFLGMIALAVIPMALGYAVKKSWLLWLAIPFWFILSLYMAYYEDWFPVTAQRSLLLIGVGAAIGLGFTAIRMQSKPAATVSTEDTLDDADNDMLEYQKELAQWKALSSTYHTKTRPRRFRYP
jgi:hypothetical protein